MTSHNTSLADIARGAGCENVVEATCESISDALRKAMNDQSKPAVIVVKVEAGNAPVHPIPLGPVRIRDRFRRLIV